MGQGLKDLNVIAANVIAAWSAAVSVAPRPNALEALF
jgi:hypothetical protein